MYLNRWDYEAQEYEKELVPEGNYKMYSADMEEKVKCPHCGKEVAFGDMYTSKEFQSDFGFGYAVCQECYDKEKRREEAYRRGKNDEKTI